jgi:uncharacterized membrane protein
MPDSPLTSHRLPEATIDAVRQGTALAILAGLTLAGFVLRLYCLGAKNLWLDEMWSVVIARMPLHSVLWSARTQDPNAALYNICLHFWMWFGQSEAAIRAFSLVCGVALIPVMYLLGKQLFHRSVGLLASGLTAVNLFHIQYSQEARAYSLVVLLVGLSSLFFVRYVEKRTLGSWAGYVLASVLAVYAHIFAILVLAAHVASLVFLRRRDVPWKGLISAAAATGFGIIPLGILVFERTRSPFVVFKWIPQPTVRRVYDLFYSLAGNANYYGIEIRHNIANKALFAIYCVVCLVTLSLAIRSWLSAKQSVETWRQGLLLVWLFLPIAVVLGFSILVQSWFINRYLLICLPALLLISAEGIHAVRPRWLAVTAFAAILITSFAGLPQYYGYRLQYQEWKSATDYIVANQLPGDGAVFCVAHGRLLFEYYRDKDHPNQSSDLDLAYPDLKNEDTDPRALSYFPQLSDDQIAAMVAKHRRVWFVLYPDDWVPGYDTSRKIEAALTRKFNRVRETKQYTVIVRLYSNDEVAGRLTGGAPGVATDLPL